LMCLEEHDLRLPVHSDAEGSATLADWKEHACGIAGKNLTPIERRLLPSLGRSAGGVHVAGGGSAGH
jgi:hypothetical protein